jgi:Zn-dependent protease
MKCEMCQREVFMPFRCPYCEGYFCPEHRLPENHNCQNLKSARAQKQEAAPMTIQKGREHKYVVTYWPIERAGKTIRFSGKEAKHLAGATLLVVGVALSMGFLSTSFGNGYAFDYATLSALAAMLTASFFVHEMAHKFVAQRKGLWAEFRLTFMGAVLTLLSAVSPVIKIISPGAVMVAGVADRKSMGKVSIAGPATNIVISAVLFVGKFLLAAYSPVLTLTAAFNAWIALFNLIPFGMLDGFKILLWSKKIWALAFTISLVLTVLAYQVGY